MENKDYIIITETDFQKARNKIKEARKQGKKIIFSGKDDELNRKILEKESFDVLLLKLGNRKDRIKQRDSGFNHVLAKLAKKKGISIGINLDEILEVSKNEKVRIMARLKQNIQLCNKNKLSMKFLSERHQKDKYDLKALGLVLGMPTSMTSQL